MLVAFIFLLAHCFLINTWSLKLIQPITTSWNVSCTTTWKHFTSSIWVNVIDFIFWLFHIVNFPLLVVLTPPRSPYTPFAEYAHSYVNNVNSSIDCDHTSANCINFSIDYANKFNDCANIHDDLVNIVFDSAYTPNISSSHLCTPNPSLLQLLFIDLLIIYRSKINIVLIVGSSIYSSSVFHSLHFFPLD
jgi:hypothetical protein